MTDIDSFVSVAQAAVLFASEELRARWHNGDISAEYGEYDVSAAADKAAESRILSVIRQSFPDHAIYAEEAGTVREAGPFQWIVDPLDGTNNFVAGQPAFGSAVAVLRAGVPLVSMVHQPVTRETYVARRGRGVRYDGRPLLSVPDVPIEAATVVTIQGRNVDPEPELSDSVTAIKGRLDDTVKRVVDSWVPTVHSGLFARGRFQGLVQFHPDREEQAVTEHLVEEADGVVRRDGPLYVAAHNEPTCQTLWETVADHE